MTTKLEILIGLHLLVNGYLTAKQVEKNESDLVIIFGLLFCLELQIIAWIRNTIFQSFYGQFLFTEEFDNLDGEALSKVVDYARLIKNSKSETGKLTFDAKHALFCIKLILKRNGMLYKG